MGIYRLGGAQFVIPVIISVIMSVVILHLKGTLLRENWTSSISPWMFVGTDLSTVMFGCYVQTFIPQALPTALPLMKIRLQSKNTSNIEFVSQSLFIPYMGNQRLICLIIWWFCYVCRVLLMVMRNEEGYLSVNCKPSLCDSLLMPLTQLQRPNTEQSSSHVCNAESSTGLSGHLTVQRFHPILRAFVAYLPIRAAVLRTPTSSKLQRWPTGNRTSVGVTAPWTECDFPLPRYGCLGFMGMGISDGA